MSPVVELLIEFRQYLRASFAAAPAFFDVSLAQQDQLAIRSLKKHHRTIILYSRVKSGDLGFSQSHRWTVQTPHGLPDINPNGFSFKSNLKQLGVNICILLKMLLSLFDQSVRVISQLSGQPREREGKHCGQECGKRRYWVASCSCVSSRLHYANTRPPQDISHFFPLWYLTNKNLTDRLLANCAKRKKLAVKDNRAPQIRAAVWNKKVLTLTLRTRRNMAASHAGSRI